MLDISGGTYTGVAATWQRRTIEDGIAFIVELGPTLTEDEAAVHADAVLLAGRRCRQRPVTAAHASRDAFAEICWWWRITSSTMKRRNFSLNAGSSPDSSARARSRPICCSSRSGSDGGRPTSAL